MNNLVHAVRSYNLFNHLHFLLGSQFHPLKCVPANQDDTFLNSRGDGSISRDQTTCDHSVFGRFSHTVQPVRCS